VGDRFSHQYICVYFSIYILRYETERQEKNQNTPRPDRL
jgi:hypothetical protein